MGSQQNIVAQDLVFTGRASYQNNVKGTMLTEKHIVDKFFSHDNSTWTEAAEGGTWTYSSTSGGAMILTSGGTAKDMGEMTYSVIYSCAKNCGMQARIKANTNLMSLCVGFADAAHGTNDEMAAEVSSAALTASRATEFAGLVWDTGSTADYFYYGAYKSGTEGTPVVTTTALVNDTFINLRVQMNTDGDATFYINGKAVGFLPTCVTTATLLTPIVSFLERGTTGLIGHVNRISVWQDEA